MKKKKINNQTYYLCEKLGIWIKEKKLVKLPKPECEWGFTSTQIETILNNDKKKLSKFYKWMDGQTVCSCPKKVYNHEKECYEPSKCFIKLRYIHEGTIYYVGDVRRFLEGLPVID